LALVVAALVTLGFGVKVPLWPFISWLIKAHVEASTEFSIFLSGLLVKFGVIGMLKSIALMGQQSLLTVVAVVGCLGILEATARMLAQIDLKRVVALTTVVETN